MKISKYNIYVENEGRKFVYNQLRSSLLEIDEELFQQLCVPTNDVDSLDNEILAELTANGMVCDNALKEENVVLANSKQHRFSNNAARVTILPTLDCNFHCWYCYENHHHSEMTPKNVEKVILFCKDVIKNGNIKYWLRGDSPWMDNPS